MAVRRSDRVFAYAVTVVESRPPESRVTAKLVMRVPSGIRTPRPYASRS